MRHAGDGSLSVGVRATRGMTLTYPVSTGSPGFPVYLRITRTGTTFSAAYSPMG